MVESDLKSMLQTLMGWGFPLLALAAAIICFTAVRVSSRVIVLGIGFLLMGAASAGRQLVTQFLLRPVAGPSDFPTIDLYFTILAGASLVAWIVIIVGLALVFSDLRHRLARASYGPPPPGREEPRPWQPRQEGRQDIQQ
jgi:hypothetical protein